MGSVLYAKLVLITRVTICQDLYTNPVARASQIS